MTIEQQDIMSDFYSGNTKDIRCTVVDALGSPKDLTGAEVVFALFREGKTDTLVLTKSSEDGGVSLTNLLGGILTVHFLPYDTLNVYGTFRYQINVTDSDGKTETVTTGRINIIRGHANRYRSAHLHCYLSGQ